MSAQLKNTDKSVEISEDFLNAAYNEALIHQVVTSSLTNARSGTKAQKTRSEVSGGGAKPWKQKGSGRARAGSIRSPIWRTGGKVFAAKPKTYDLKINKKMYSGAMKSIFSELHRAERLVVIENFDITEPKTKALVNVLVPYLVGSEKITLITEAFDMNLFLSSRNLKNVFMVDVELIDPVTLVGSDKVIITAGALKSLEEVLV
ncbi:MAG: 50S ribosomal protein L4 [Gammaproteobacteria bacterium]|nr:50S ribosomal protein L4 [Gammaproteobacteria bacterium]